MLKRLLILLGFSCLVSCVLVPDFTPGLNTDRTEAEKGRAAFDSASYGQAAKHLAPEAEHGDIDAQYMLGLIYLYGLSGEKNSFLAQKYLVMAANNGHYAAQEQLAFMYEDPYQPLHNPIDAYHWFKIVTMRKPAYRARLDSLRWNLQTRGLLSKAETMPDPRDVLYHGVDYNAMFPYR